MAVAIRNARRFIDSKKPAVTERPARMAPPDTTIVTGAAGWLGRALLDQLRAGPARPGRRGQSPGHERRRRRDACGGIDGVRPGRRRRPPRRRSGRAVRRPHGRRRRDPHRRRDPPGAGRRLRGGQRPRYGQRDARRPGRTVSGASSTCRRTARSARTPHRLDTFRNDEPYHPYVGYGRSKMQAELAVSRAVGRRARRRDRAAAVVLRPVPAATPDDVLPDGADRPVPGDRRRPAAALDGLRRQPRRRASLAAELTPTPAGRAWWIADAEPYEVREIVDDGRTGAARRGLRRRPESGAAAGDRRPPRRARRHAGAAHGPLHPGAARPRRDGQDDRLRHLGRSRRARLRARRRPLRGHAAQHPLVRRAGVRACDHHGVPRPRRPLLAAALAGARLARIADRVHL